MTDETIQEKPQEEPNLPADNVDRDEQLDTAFERLEKRKTEVKVEKVKPSSSMTGMLAILLALVAIGIGSFAVYTLFKPQDVNPLDELANQLSTDLASMQRDLKSSANEMGLVSSRIDDIEGRQTKSLAGLKDNLESRMADLQAAAGTRSQDWILAEVEYLLRIGNQRVLMESDPKGALALFKAADNIIRDAEGLTAFSLREALASDIASLEAVNMLDKEGIYLRLSAFTGQVGELKQIELNYAAPVTAAESSPASEASILNRLWVFVRKAGNRIASLIDFRRDQVRITPILPPSEAYFLQQNLILKLQVAQIALLESNQDIYSTSIGESIAWIEKYYDPEDTVTISLNSGLEALLAIDVQMKMPDVTASLREVRKLLSVFHQSESKP